MQHRFVKIEFKGKRRGTYLSAAGYKFEENAYVLVETTELPQIGKVILNYQTDISENCYNRFKKVLRYAEPNEIDVYRDLLNAENQAMQRCWDQIRQRSLPMKLLDVQFASDQSKVTFYFTAEQRVDFRDLVKGLATIFKTRIELRQVGVRDEAKRLDGYGPCGQQLCCSSFLKDFAPITLKMARDQHISLTPSKISGVCGRLLCCLEYEHEMYCERTKHFPELLSEVTTKDDKKLKVQSIDIFKDTIVGLNADGVEMRIPLTNLKPWQAGEA